MSVLNPTAAFQTLAVQSASYYSFFGNAGERYQFSFCQGGGASTFDSDITITDASGVVLDYADRGCTSGLNADMTFVVPQSATYQVHISAKADCFIKSSATLAYRNSPILNNEPCTAEALTVECTPFYRFGSNNTATPSTSIPNPSCGNYTGNDIWYKILVPSTRNVNIEVRPQTIGQVAFAVYSGNCNTLTEVGCSSSAGAGLPAQLNLVNQTANTFLWVRVYSSVFSSGSFSISAHLDDPNKCFTVNGSASKLSCDCYRITPASNTQAGSVWNNSQLDLNEAFDFTFAVYLGTNDGGADGMSFALQPVSTTVGSAGGGIGFQGINPSVGIVMDTYCNASDPRNIPGDDPNGTKDPTPDHISLHKNGDVYHQAPNQLKGPLNLPNIEDGNDHILRVTWEPSTNTLVSTFDGANTITHTEDIVNTIFSGDSRVYWGFAASTGGLNNEHRFCLAIESIFNVTDVDKKICLGDTFFFQDLSKTFFPISTWNWNFGDGNTSNKPNPSHKYAAAGNYVVTLTITDRSGCTSTVNLNVTVDPAPQPQIANGIVDCTNPQYTPAITGNLGTGGYTYSWKGPQFATPSTSSSVNITTAGTYTLDITNGSGCKGSKSFQVSVDTIKPVVALSGTGDLGCGKTTVTRSYTGGMPGFTQVWSGPGIQSGGTAKTVVINQAGDYTLTVTNPINGCTRVRLFTIIELANPPILNPIPDQILDCASLNKVVNASLDPQGEPGNLKWETPSGTQTSGGNVLVNTNGTYKVIAIASSGCTDTIFFLASFDTVKPKLPVFPKDTITCTKDVVIINASTTIARNPSFSINGPGGNTTQSSRSTSGPGTFVVTVTDENGCQATANVIVAQDIEKPIIAIQTPVELNCTVLSTQLSSSISNMPFTTVNWNGPGITNGKTTQTPTVNRAGIYTVTYTKKNGCSETMSVTVISNTTKPTLEAGAPIELNCTVPTQVTNIQVNDPNLSFKWSGPDVGPNETSKNITVAKAGTYSVTATGANGCVSIDAIIVTSNKNIVANAGNDGTLNCLITTLVLDGSKSTGPGLNYAWTGPGTIVGANSSTPTINAAGEFTLSVSSSNGCVETDVVLITLDSIRPVFTIANPGDLTCRNPNRLLEVTITNMIQVQSYNWTLPNGANSTNATQDATQVGVYQVLVTGRNGCSRSGSIQMKIDTIRPNFTIQSNAVISCDNPTGNIQLTFASPQPNATIVWAGSNLVSPNGGLTMEVNSGSQVQCTVTAANGCSRTRSISLQVDTIRPQAIINNPQTLNCNRSSVELNGTLSTPTIRSYAWTGPIQVQNSSSAIVFVDASGVYTLEVIANNGCSRTASIQVIHDIAPVAAVIDIPSLDCISLIDTLDASNSIGDQIQFRWLKDGVTTGNDTFLIINSGGNYELIITDQFNCTDRIPIVVNQDTIRPIIRFAPYGDLTCTDITVNLDATASTSNSGNFMWLGPNIQTGFNPASVLVSEPADYTLVVSNLNGCTRTMIFPVHIDTVSPILSANFSNPFSCIQQNTTLSASDARGRTVSWLWTGNTVVGNSTQSSITATDFGPFVVQATADNGCISELDVIVAIDTVKPVFAFIQPDTLDCKTETVEIQITLQAVQMPIQTVWNGPDLIQTQNTKAVVGTSGSYTAEVTHKNGCTALQTIEVQEDYTLPNAEIIASMRFVEPRRPVILDATTSTGRNNTYTWKSDSLNSNLKTASIQIQKGGTYIVIVESANGCIDSTEINLPELFADNIVVPNAFSPSGKGANAEFWPVALNFTQILEVSVFNRWGQRVFNSTSDALKWNGTWKDAPQELGVYVVVVRYLPKGGDEKVYSGNITLLR